MNFSARHDRLHLVAFCSALAACAPAAPLEDGDGTSPAPTETDSGDGDPSYLCVPETVVCADAETIGVCAATGQSWEEYPCGDYEHCQECAPDDEDCTEPHCVGPCDISEELPTSTGCSFHAIRLLHWAVDSEFKDAVVVGNANDEDIANVQLYWVPMGSNQEEALGEPVSLAPGEIAEFELTPEIVYDTSSLLGTGGLFRVQSDLPIVAYLHSPFTASNSSDSSLLLPDQALGTDYVIASYPTHPNNEPSYFTVISISDGTVVEWTPKADTSGNGLPLSPVAAGETGTQVLNRFDNMRIAAASLTEENLEARDVSGTVVHANSPIWVIGVSRCATVPYGEANCDHLQEQMIPLKSWGTTYVGAHSPVRASEPHFWRVYAGADDTTVTTDPPQPGTPVTLAKRGDWVELEVPNGTNFMFEGDKAFLPVQYLASRTLADEIGDPAMYQMIPVEQFLDAYVFVTAKDYEVHYAQIIRAVGGADVFVDGVVVDDGAYEPVGDYEVATWTIEEGSHVARSDDPFGVIQVGYASYAEAYTSYAYPGGMRTEEIFVP